jgi:hypothetical protein
MNNQKTFKNIYLENTWGDPESKSGTGSNLKQTQVLRKELPKLLNKLGINTLLDIPCGDFYWMNLIKSDLGQILQNYTGGDLVSELTEENNKKYADSKFNFLVLDLKESNLPKSDIVLCRDCLVHLSYSDIIKCLRNIKRSKSKYLLTTTFSEKKNKNIVTGAWRPINLCSFPFKMKTPKIIILENCSEGNGGYHDKSLALWEVGDINISVMIFNLFIHNVRGLIRKITVQMNAS